MGGGADILGGQTPHVPIGVTQRGFPPRAGGAVSTTSDCQSAHRQSWP